MKRPAMSSEMKKYSALGFLLGIVLVVAILLGIVSLSNHKAYGSYSPYLRETSHDETVKTEIPFTEEKVNDSALDAGQSATRQDGVPGEKTVVIRHTKKGNRELSSVVVSEAVTRPPVNRILAIGTRAAVQQSGYSTGQRGSASVPDIDWSKYDTPNLYHAPTTCYSTGYSGGTKTTCY